jgi:predicted small metal-binding protein
MGKKLSCMELGRECDFVACGSSDEEVFSKMTVHSKTAHNIMESPETFRERARSAMEEVNVCSQPYLGD